MYRTCLYCAKDLGSNDVLETLPIGRRIAFDQAHGRLWVICRNCEKWCLVPFDTRLETIDACEDLFRQTRTRFSTDHIGIARLKEGLELVRIGPALRPEFAAWRYGDQFGRRRRRNIAIGAGVAAGGVAIVSGAMVLGAGIGGFGVVIQQAGKGFVHLWRRNTIALRLPMPDGEPALVITRADLAEITVVSYRDGWALALNDRRVGPLRAIHSDADLNDVFLHGPDAVTALGRILPKMAGMSGSRVQVRDAVEALERWPATEDIVATFFSGRNKSLKAGQPYERLALEMAVHEESERTALAGELKLLEREWRKAEELAAIADDLAVSDDVHARVGSRS